MAKNKKRNKKTKLSERVFEKKVAAKGAPRLNPFEFKKNREKHSVLNRKIKHAEGTPGVSRSRAMAKRKETLLKEYQQRNTGNKFVDNRIGEYNTDISVEDKMLARFTIEQKRRHKGTKFNLDDGGDAHLTHLGQSLGQIDRFDDPRSDDEEEGGRSGGAFNKRFNFGGFPGEGGERSHKEWIEELISESKQRKQERQSDRDVTEELTTKLDSDWKDVQNLMSSFKASNDKTASTAKSTSDDYDIMLRELKFESRGKATDRLKTPDELARDEREKLEKMETDRLNRMKGILTSYVKGGRIGNHVSADDLDDGFEFGRKNRKSASSHNDDEAITAAQDERVGANEESDDGNSSDEEKDEDDDDEEEEEEDGEGDSEEEKDSSEDEGEDLQESDDGTGDKVAENNGKSKSSLKVQREDVMKKAQKELPYTFAAPENYQDFVALIEGHSTDSRLTIVERIIKCHHPSLAEGNKDKLETFFAILLQTMNDACALPDESEDDHQLDLHLVDGLIPHLFDLARFSPQKAAECVLAVVMEKQEQFQAECEGRSTGRATLPHLDTLIFFKLASLLFPTSDFRHVVITPAALFMELLLTKGVYNSNRDIYVGLFICSLFREYVSLSKRLVPEVLNFLRGVLCMGAMPDRQSSDLSSHLLPPFKSNGALADLLEQKPNNGQDVKADVKKISLKLLNEDGPPHSDFRIQVLHTTLTLVQQFSKLHSELACYRELYAPFLEICEHLSSSKMSPKFKETLTELTSQLREGVEDDGTAKVWLCRADKKPVPLKQFEPRIAETFDGRKQRKDGPKEFQDQQRLVHKYKREMKGAVREIRRDNQFLARYQIQEQLDRDAERKQKLKRIYSDLMEQQGYCNGLERKKKVLKIREKS